MKKITTIIAISILSIFLIVGLGKVFATSTNSGEKSNDNKQYSSEKDEKTSIQQEKNALYSLKEAKVKLFDSYENLLNDEIKDEEDFRNSKKYKEVDLKVSSNYENALTAAKAILENRQAKKEQQENALLNLIEAKINLTEDFPKIINDEISKSDEIRNSEAYKKASLEVSSNYENALAAARAILENIDNNNCC